MSLNEICKSHNKLVESKGFPLLLIKEHLLNLSFHLLILAEEHSSIKMNIKYREPNTIAKNYITFSEFLKKHKIFAKNTIYKRRREDKFFCDNFVRLHNNIYYIEAEKAFEYLKNTPVFKKRLERYFDAR